MYIVSTYRKTRKTQLLSGDKISAVSPLLSLTVVKRDSLLSVWTSHLTLPPFFQPHCLIKDSRNTEEMQSLCAVTYNLQIFQVIALKQLKVLIMVLDANEKNCWILELSGKNNNVYWFFFHTTRMFCRSWGWRVCIEQMIKWEGYVFFPIYNTENIQINAQYENKWIFLMQPENSH